MVRVAYQGEPGAFSEQAAANVWGSDADPVPYADFPSVVAAVALGVAEAGILPVENVIAGCVEPAVDAVLANDGVCVIGETTVPIRLQVLAPAGASLGSLHTVESQPIALAQCGGWLSRHAHLRAVQVEDTAAAARGVASSADPRRAAIASAAAGARYGLAVLARDIEDDAENATRFWALARTSASARPNDGRRAIVVVPSAAKDEVRSIGHATTRQFAEREVGGVTSVILELQCASSDAMRELLAAFVRLIPSGRIVGQFSPESGVQRRPKGADED